MSFSGANFLQKVLVGILETGGGRARGAGDGKAGAREAGPRKAGMPAEVSSKNKNAFLPQILVPDLGDHFGYNRLSFQAGI